MTQQKYTASVKKYFLLKFLPVILTAGVTVGCATTKQKEETVEDYLRRPQKTEQVIEEEAQKTEGTLEQRLDPNNPEDLKKIVTEENRYHWKRDAIELKSLSWYNPTILNLWTGFRKGDLVVILLNEDGTHTVAEKAKVNFYPELKAATIAYRINRIWYETTPNDAKGNIDLNSGNKGGIYKLTSKIFEWPKDPYDALLKGLYNH